MARVPAARVARIVRFPIVALAAVILAPRPAAAQTSLTAFAGVLAGASVVPSTPSLAVGYTRVNLVAGSLLSLTVRYSGLASACTAINVRGPALPGANGPIVFTTTCSSTSGVTWASFVPSAGALGDFKNGLCYVEVVNATYPGGEIRAQVTLADAIVGHYTSAGVVPTPSTSVGTGTVVVTIGPGNYLDVASSAGNTGNVTSAHLHGPAYAGSAGPVVAALALGGGFSDGIFVQLTDQQAADVRSGRAYIDLHTAQFPDGAVRAQLHRPNPLTDFDGEGRAEFSLFRPPAGTWYMQNPLSPAFTSVAWGASTDTPVPGDYDGDGASDVAVFRSGTFYIRTSLFGAFRAVPFGLSSDQANIPGDFDGDGRADVAVFRSNGVNTYFYWLQSLNDAFRAMQWGVANDQSVNGDYDGDRKSDVGVYRPSANTYYILGSATGALTVFPFGVSQTDDLAPGDYDGDGKTDFTVFRSSGGGAGVWYIWQSATGTLRAEAFGAAGDVAVPGDYDGDGKADLAVVRLGANMTWYVKRSSDGGLSAGVFGLGSDVPAALVLIR